MRTVIIVLAILAAIQILVAGILQIDSPQLATSSERNTLLSFTQSQVDGVTVKTADGEVVLQRQGEGDAKTWQLVDGFPVDQGKVDKLLESLQGLKAGLAAATTEEAAQRFKVAEDDFERHVVLKRGDDELASLFVGSGAGARRSHVRVDGTDAIYSVGIGSYEIPASVDEWQDKALLQLTAEEVTGLTLGELKLKRDEGWTAEAGLPEGRLLNVTAVDEALAPLLSLRIGEVLGKETKPEYGLEQPVLELALAHKNGERNYQFGKRVTEAKEGEEEPPEEYVLKVSDREEYFKLPSWSVTQLLEKLTVEGLVLAEAGDEAEAESNAESVPSSDAGQAVDVGQPVSD